MLGMRIHAMVVRIEKSVAGLKLAGTPSRALIFGVGD